MSLFIFYSILELMLEHHANILYGSPESILHNKILVLQLERESAQNAV
jgi:hypothetical protein